MYGHNAWNHTRIQRPISRANPNSNLTLMIFLTVEGSKLMTQQQYRAISAKKFIQPVLQQ